jgi:TRAP-type C4-dicarboxylate transport system permease small subunit
MKMTLDEKIQNSKIWKVLLAIQKTIMVVSTVCVVATLLAVVLGRHIFHYNFLGYNEIIVIAAFWMYFIGSSYASWEESHINADILGQFLPERKKAILGVFTKIIQVIIGIPLIYLSFQSLVFDIKANPTTLDLGIPLAFPRSAMLICFVLMTFYSGVYAVRDIYKLKKM